MRETFLADAESRIGFCFSDKSLLRLALTHSTWSNAHGGGNNERLEFLGDAVLELIVSERLYRMEERGRTASEGEMTEMRQRLVSGSALAAAARRLGLGEYLRFEGGASNVGAKTISSLFEALVAAIYLDPDGGYPAAERFVLENLELTGGENYKNRLQEYMQAQPGGEMPEYGEAHKTGEDHAPVWTATVRAGGLAAEGTGKSISAAEQEAAKKMLGLLARGENAKISGETGKNKE